MLFIRVFLLVVLSTPAIPIQSAQLPAPPSEPDTPADVHLPNGRSQRHEIIKADYAKNVEDARELVKLSEELRSNLEKNSEYVFSVSDLKKTEEIEKVARRIRSRMKRY